MKAERCVYCSNYSAYYKRRTSNFEKLSHGVCQVCKQEKKESEACEKFNYNERKEKQQKQILLLSLELAAKGINEMIQILKEKEGQK